MLAGVTVLFTTLKYNAEVKGEAIRKPLNFTASMHTNGDETEVRKWAGFKTGWLSFCSARQRDRSNQSLWSLEI